MKRQRPTPNPRSGTHRKESPLLADIRLAVGSRRDFMACRINTGVFRPLHGDQKRVIRSAPTGFPDLVGVQRRVIERVEQVSASVFNPVEKRGPFVYGQAIAIETKAAKGSQRDEQIAFERAWAAMGGIYILARSVEDVLAVLGPDSAPD